MKKSRSLDCVIAFHPSDEDLSPGTPLRSE